MKLPGRWERVENGVIAGMPDVNFCVAGMEGWIELKKASKPAKMSTVLFKSQRGLDKEQENWHHFQAKNGGDSWVLIQIDREFYAIPGVLAPEINQYTMEDMEKYQINLSDWLFSLTMPK
jgi:hypothetical protein